MSTSTADRASVTGLLITCAASLMLFAALTSAMVIRRGTGDDWNAITMPGAAWASLAVIISSSILLETGRKRLGIAAGVLFLGLQAMVWRSLEPAGISVAFFYVLSVTHAVHVAAGLIALVKQRAVSGGLAVYYWHFVGALWCYLVYLFGAWA